MIQHIQHFGLFINRIVQQRYVIQQMVRRDFQVRYLGSYLGLFWAFAQPLVMLAVIYFAFSYGLRLNLASGEYPFALWLVCGLVPWQFMQEAIGGGTDSLLAYSYLIRKTAFSRGIIPLIKVFTSLILHLVLLLLLLIWVWAAGFAPGWHWLQLPYYLLASFLMLSGLGWLLGSLSVFVRDIGLAVKLGLGLLFWLTPIFWSPEMIASEWRFLIWANPLYFLVQGYRSVLLEGMWFWEIPVYQAYSWGISTFMFVAGAMVFRRLRPHFADML